MAARLHEFNRSPADIIKIVKVHESTLRKRWNLFQEQIYGSSNDLIIFNPLLS